MFSMSSKGSVTNLAEDSREPPPFFIRLKQADLPMISTRHTVLSHHWLLSACRHTHTEQEQVKRRMIKKEGKDWNHPHTLMLGCHHLVLPTCLPPAPLRLCSICASGPGLGNGQCSFFVDDPVSGSTCQNDLFSPSLCTPPTYLLATGRQSISTLYIRILQDRGDDMSGLQSLSCTHPKDIIRRVGLFNII